MSWKNSGPHSQNNCTTTPIPTLSNGGAINRGFTAKPITQVIAELKSGEGLRIAWLWENYIPAGGLVILAGHPKAGKSTLARHIALAVSKGEEFLGLGTQASKVLWLGLEERLQDVARRFNDLGPNESLFYKPGPFRSTQDNLSDLETWITSNEVKLIIVDTLPKFWAGVDDENSASKTDKAMDAILRLARNTGAAFLLLAHTRKTPSEGGNEIRGSSAVFGNVDVGITLRRDGDSPSRAILHTQSRYDETPDGLTIELKEGRYEALGEIAEVRAKEREQGLLGALTVEFQDVPAIARRADIAETTARRNLKRLADSGKIEASGTGKRGSALQYRLLNDCTTTKGARNGVVVESAEENLGMVQAVFPEARLQV